MRTRYAVVDVETTGGRPEYDKITEIAIVLMEQDEIIHTWHTLINPGRRIPDSITRLTGIDNEMVYTAPEFGQVSAQVLELLQGQIIVGHNVNFDLGFIENQLGVLLPNDTLDTVKLAKMILPNSRSLRLGSLTKDIGIEHTMVHRALGDAQATAQLLVWLRQQVLRWPWQVIFTLQSLIDNHLGSYKSFFAEVIRHKTANYSFDGHVATLSPDSLEHTELFGGYYNIPTKSVNNQVELDVEEIAGHLTVDGAMAKAVVNYQYRPQQQQMLEAIVNALNTGSHLVVEAGTGTGKSLAYLIPTIMWSLRSGKKTAISTKTITLQEQLWHKDIPLLRQVINEEFKVALVKGRSNYLCRRRWDHWLKESGTSPEGFPFAVQVLNWLSTTTTGDRSELNLFKTDYQLWSQVSGDNESCLGSRCQYHQKNCFITKARRLAEEADLLIANHALILADMKLDNKVLPAYEVLVVDEAHHLEKEATEQMGYGFDYPMIMQQLNNLFSSGTTKESIGLINNLRFRTDDFKKHLEPEEFIVYQRWIEEVIQATLSTKEGVANFFALTYRLIKHRLGDDQQKIQIRVDRPESWEEYWQGLDGERSNLKIRLQHLVDTLRKLILTLETTHAGPSKFGDDLRDLQSNLNMLKEHLECFSFVTQPDTENFVYWLEGTNRSEVYPAYRAVPIMVNQILYERMFTEKATVILTSATLTVHGDFQYITHQLGLDLCAEGRVNFQLVDSPFNYEKQALLCLVRDIPEPTEDEWGYINGLGMAIRDFVTVCGGRSLVLFTSHRHLQEVYSVIKEPLEAAGYAVLGHGVDGGRAKLVEEYKNQEKAVLLGTDTFWEGLDLPGDYLKCLIIVRIPFAVPTVPQVEARLEYLTKLRLDSFMSYSLPQAIIRFKQGVGRLIRTEQDKGTVIVLDKRIVSKRYGQHILRSIPLTNQFKGETDLVVEKVRNWLDGRQPVTNPSWKAINSVEALEKMLGTKISMDD